MENKKCNIEGLNAFAHIYPFSIFTIDINRPPKKLEAITKDINESPLYHKINTNDIIISQVIVSLIGVIITAILIVLKSKFNFNIKTGHIVYTFVVTQVISMSIKMYIKTLLKSYNRDKINSIQVINNYIITMLKGDKVVSEILYSLTTIKTPYREEFVKGYQLYKKNDREGFKYLQDVFKETYFKETLKVLSDYSKYDKVVSLKYLKRINKTIKRQINNLKKQKYDISFIYSQTSVVLPLGLIGLLIILPIMSVAFNAIQTSFIK